MRILLLGSASLLALATPAYAQDEPSADAAASEQGVIDTLVDDAPAAEAAPAPTGDPVLDRLNALEARLKQVEARNKQLEEQAELNQDRIESVEVRAAKAAQFTWGPSFSEPTGSFTFKPRGVIQADLALFKEREGGYDYNNGTAFRRARLGFDGTAFKWFNYRAEVEFAGNAVQLLDFYVQYTKIPKTLITLGQHKAPFGLEANNSDSYNIFLERGKFTNAFGNAGAERRIGASVAYAPKENLNLAAGIFGESEAIGRAGSTISGTNNRVPDESWGFNGRATWEPLFDTAGGRIIHVGASAYYRTALRSGDIEDAVRLTDRPNVRVDNGNIADSGVIGAVGGHPDFGGGAPVKSLKYGGVEAAAVFGPITLAGEYGKLWLDRADADNLSFHGFYGFASWFITGETRPFKGGNFDRIRPRTEFAKDGWGAFELAARYDKIDLSDTPGCRSTTITSACSVLNTAAGNEAKSVTLGLNWYLNPYLKFMVNWIRFSGDNTPLDPEGNATPSDTSDDARKTKGDAFAGRLHLDF